MIYIPATALTVSVIVFCVLLILVQKEHNRKQLFFASKARLWLDEKVGDFEKQMVSGWNHFTRYFVQLNWYYSIHSLLKTAMQVIVTFYTYIEKLFEKNRSRAKKLRAEKRKISQPNHLSQMAEHKEGTALTESQKTKLKRDKLEERH
jgi:hypothetical protein